MSMQDAARRRKENACSLLTKLYECIRVSTALVASELLMGSNLCENDLKDLANYGRHLLTANHIYLGRHGTERIWMLDTTRASKHLSLGGELSTQGYSDTNAKVELATAKREGKEPGPAALNAAAHEGRRRRRSKAARFNETDDVTSSAPSRSGTLSASPDSLGRPEEGGGLHLLLQLLLL